MNLMIETATVVLGLVQGVLAVVAVLIGWIMRGLFARMEKMETADAKLAEEITALRVTLPTLYIAKADHEKQLDAIFEILRRIDEKLDKKADKP